VRSLPARLRGHQRVGDTRLRSSPFHQFIVPGNSVLLVPVYEAG
jgi:hypothetical protein